MTDKQGPGQADKRAAEVKTAEVASENDATRSDTEQRRDEATSAAALSLQVDQADIAINPYPNYDSMTVEQLQKLADERGVEINRDVIKAHLVTELRAADTHTR